MKKLLILGLVMLVLVTSMVSAETLTDAQLATKTNQQIKDTLLDTLELENKFIDYDDQRVYLYYSSKTIEPQGNEWLVKDITLRTVIPFSHIQYCFSLYTNSQCKTGLVYNFGNYYTGDYTDANEDGIVQEEEKIYSETVYQQLKNKLTSNYQQILAYRDEAKDTTSTDLTGGLETTPSVSI